MKELMSEFQIELFFRFIRRKFRQLIGVGGKISIVVHIDRVVWRTGSLVAGSSNGPKKRRTVRRPVCTADNSPGAQYAVAGDDELINKKTISTIYSAQRIWQQFGLAGA